MRDDRPRYESEGLPDKAEFGRLALQLLRAMAKDDPDIAEKMRQIGIPLED